MLTLGIKGQNDWAFKDSKGQRNYRALILLLCDMTKLFPPFLCDPKSDLSMDETAASLWPEQLVVFFDICEVVHSELIPYRVRLSMLSSTALRHLWEDIWCKWLWHTGKWMLHHDNAPIVHGNNNNNARVSQERQKKKHWGRRAITRNTLKAQAQHPPLPSILFAGTQSLESWMHDLVWGSDSNWTCEIMAFFI